MADAALGDGGAVAPHERERHMGEMFTDVHTKPRRSRILRELEQL